MFWCADWSPILHASDHGVIERLLDELEAPHVYLGPTDDVQEGLEQIGLARLAGVPVDRDPPAVRMAIDVDGSGGLVLRPSILYQRFGQLLCRLVSELVPDVGRILYE